jgi:hypothetical protein
LRRDLLLGGLDKVSWSCLKRSLAPLKLTPRLKSILDVDVYIFPREMITRIRGLDFFIFLPFFHNTHAPLFFLTLQLCMMPEPINDWARNITQNGLFGKKNFKTVYITNVTFFKI